MTDDPSSPKHSSHPPAVDISKRDAALAVVDEILSDGPLHRPRLKTREPAPETPPEAPINIDEVAEPAPPSPPKRKGRAGEAQKRGGISALHWIFQTLLLLFVLAWVFLLGIFIGRGYLMKHPTGREFIAWVETFTSAPADVPAVEEVSAEENPPPQPVSPVAEETWPQGAVSALAVAFIPPAPEDEFLTPETLAQAATGPEPEREPAPEPAPEPQPEPEPQAPPVKPQLAPPGESGYAVQTTYALTEKAARALIDRLKRQGFPAYFYKNSRDQYLVRVGRFKTADEARKARDALAEIGYKEPYISKLEPGER